MNNFIFDLQIVLVNVMQIKNTQDIQNDIQQLFLHALMTQIVDHNMIYVSLFRKKKILIKKRFFFLECDCDCGDGVKMGFLFGNTQQ